MKEMVDQNVLTLTEKHLVTKQISLMISYSKDCIKPSCGSCKITNCTNSYSILLEEFQTTLYSHCESKLSHSTDCDWFSRCER